MAMRTARVAATGYEARVRRVRPSHAPLHIDSDLVFKKADRVLVTQIKTSSADGWIRYQPENARESAVDLINAAAARDGRAVMVLVQLSEAPATVLAERDGLPVLETSMPEATLITWAEPLAFGDLVEAKRDEYAQGSYKYGKKKGQPLPRTGLGYPACVSQFPELDPFLIALEAASDAGPSGDPGGL